MLIVEWFGGSALRPFLSVLNTDMRRGFVAEYSARIAALTRRVSTIMSCCAFRGCSSWRHTSAPDSEVRIIARHTRLRTSESKGH